MCLLVMAWRAHPHYRLIVAANRDEFHARPTAPLAVWQDAPDILAGRDLSARGTWLAVDRYRRFGVITNFRDVQARRPEAPSRGGLIPDWLLHGADPATFLGQLEPAAQSYAGFNLLLTDADSLCYASNRAPRFSAALQPGLYGLSNLLLDTPWPKLTRVRERFAQWLDTEGSTDAPASDASRGILFDMLADRTRSLPDPAAGARPLPPEWVEVLSSPFVVHPLFGTRCTTIVMIGNDDSVCIQERRFGPDGEVSGQSGWQLAGGEWPAQVTPTLDLCASICIMRATLCSRPAVLQDTQQYDRRSAIVRILRSGLVRKQGDLVAMLQRDGYAVTQSSISRDLRDLGVSKAGGRYVMPPDEVARANGDFAALALFVRQIVPAGDCLTVVRTTIGAAGSVAVAIDKAEWPEVVGTISGDDTIFIATAGEPAQLQLLARLRSNFRV